MENAISKESEGLTQKQIDDFLGMYELISSEGRSGEETMSILSELEIFKEKSDEGGTFGSRLRFEEREELNQTIQSIGAWIFKQMKNENTDPSKQLAETINSYVELVKIRERTDQNQA